MKVLLTIDEAAEYLSIRPWTLRAWVSQKRIPYIKLGRLVRFELKSLEQFIRKNTIESEY